MPRTKGSKNTKMAQQPRKQTKQITCSACGENKNVSEYYISYNPIHSTGRISYCKDCLRKMISDDKGNVQLEKLKNTLKLIDRPFIYDLWKTSLDDKMDTWGCYIKNLQLPQNRRLGWADSLFLPEAKNEINYDNVDIENIKGKSDFQLTNDILNKWGMGYDPEEYEAFERKYLALKNNYPEKTAMHTEALLNYIRYRCKEEMATAKKDVKEAKEWGALANSAATAAKINPSQLSAADLADGLSTFGQLTRAVERAVDIIPILPHFKEKPQDKVDFTLWCYINYIRDLKGLPLCDYKDIYKFYEERKKDYENRFDFLKDKDDLIEDEDVAE
jgi:hypothetical protein